MGNAQSPTENLSGNKAIEKIKTIAETARTCFFTTNIGGNTTSRPMALQEVDEAGILWFLSDVRSLKNDEIEANPNVELYFKVFRKNPYQLNTRLLWG
ncbi:pyridoxamine 5'-phosphate oxidase family protein [Empedobacter sp. UBA5924]|uniref:pyridoxamine 5'-phosphate oxidase family protein n=1 Tax=Empedobacter sp. UBA5924 TaxID=1946443 RepID=UPI0025C295FA|nr:pyridoxamine 5'-phosphate oxidase family protein [Empedobacter sp. UBA5924]